MFDIFYFTKKPNLFPHEQRVENIEQALTQCRTRYCWIINYLIDYKNFDFDWEPNLYENTHRHVWPSQHQPNSGTWLLPKSGYQDTNYHNDIILKSKIDWNLWTIQDDIDRNSFDFTWHPNYSDPPYIYQFGTQWYDRGGPRYIPHEANQSSPVKYINRNILKAQLLPNKDHWEIPDEIDIDNFDFSWRPHPDDPPYIYQFGTQHQKTGGPRYVTPGATDVKYVTNIQSQVEPTATKIVMIDHFNKENHEVYQSLGKNILPLSRARFVDNYFDTLLRIVRDHIDSHEYIWIVSSICNYKDFDFTWHPEQWQFNMIHVFPSQEQKFGDTFFINTREFLHEISHCNKLQDMVINFTDIAVPRYWPDIISHDEDSQVLPVVSLDFLGPIAIFQNQKCQYQVPTISLWDEPLRQIVPISHSGSVTLIPKNSIPYIKNQIYDYPYINTEQKQQLDQPLDIIFISNGESNADDNYQYLQQQLVNRKNKLIRIDRVIGRVNAYHAAAQASQTRWAFYVFGKLQVDKNFDWDWQPDCLQQPKHYIFHAVNPVNNLEYGHQAVIAYNKKSALTNSGSGLDFTLDQPHEVIPILSGIAYYNTDAWTTWRTAFREAIKLKHNSTDNTSQYRLEQWLSQDNIKDDISCYSLLGANDAVEYYDSVNGQIDQLRKSYEWQWLADYAVKITRLSRSQIINV